MSPRGRKKSTFIEEARRKQIIDAAVSTIAEQGYNNASLNSIAERIDVTRGVISYHFDGRDDLINATIQSILGKLRSYRQERVEATEGSWNKIQVFIRSNIDFIKTYPDHIIAMIELWGNFVSIEVKSSFNAELYDPTRDYLEAILLTGQESGELMEFNARTISSLVQGAVDGVMLQWVFNPGAIDLEQSAEELIILFQRRLKH